MVRSSWPLLLMSRYSLTALMSVASSMVAAGVEDHRVDDERLGVRRGQVKLQHDEVLRAGGLFRGARTVRPGRQRHRSGRAHRLRGADDGRFRAVDRDRLRVVVGDGHGAVQRHARTERETVRQAGAHVVDHEPAMGRARSERVAGTQRERHQSVIGGVGSRGHQSRVNAGIVDTVGVQVVPQLDVGDLTQIVACAFRLELDLRDAQTLGAGGLQLELHDHHVLLARGDVRRRGR